MKSTPLECIEINPGADPCAVVIWLHGLGADGHDFEPIVPQLHLPESLPVRFVFPHAPLQPVTINGGMVMRAWFDILDMRLDRKVDMDNFREAGALLEQLIEIEMSAGMPSERILLAGFSQGGAVALHTGLRYPKRLAGIMGLSTYLPTADSLDREGSPANRDIPVMMAHGTHDPMVPLANAMAARQALEALDYHVSWQDYPMEHAVCPEEIGDIRSWLVKVLAAA